jgi:hypothetical protein
MKCNEFNLPDDCASMMRELFDYWTSIHPGEGLPGRCHFDPLDVFHLSSHIWLLDVERPLRFRFRRIGGVLVSKVGTDNTGKFLDEVYSDILSKEAGKLFIHTAETGTPTFRRGSIISDTAPKFQTLERMSLPLATDGENVDMLLNITQYSA